MNKFFITSAIPYVNAKPHVGHALEYVQADVIRRFKNLQGYETKLLCGGDENAIKNVQAAEKKGEDIQTFINHHSILFEQLAKRLNVTFDIFQKGSSQQHHLSSQELWKRCFTSGDIYKKAYSGLYCVGCEQFYEKDELNEKGECFEHPGRKLEEVTEENYFFKLSNYQKQIEELIESDQLKITPVERKNEVLSFVRQGLTDISISRSNERAKNWGVSVPDDTTQKMYVWFDALNIYQSGVGFGWNDEMYKKWWPADIHVLGKGIIRFHAVYWPAFLLSAKLPLPKSLFVHGYFTVNGQKMSKTLGNVIDPNEVIDKYGTDTLRYYFLREIPSTGDGDFSERRLKEIYTSDLQHGLGNLISRVAALIEKNNLNLGEIKFERENKLWVDVSNLLKLYRFNEALELIWNAIRGLDRYINQERPWKLAELEAKKILSHIVIGSEALISIREIAESLKPFLPETSEKILKTFSAEKIHLDKPLFPKLD